MQNGSNGVYTDSSLQQYFRDIKDRKKYPILSIAEQAELMKSAEKGNIFSIQKLIFSNLRLAASIAWEYYRRGSAFELGELINQANDSLVHAARTCNTRKSKNFPSYANTCIRNALDITNAKEGNIVRRPWNHYMYLPKIRKVQDRHYAGTGQSLSSYDIAKRLKMTKQHVEDSLNIDRRVLSLDVKVYDDDDPATHRDLLPSKANSPFEDMKQKDLVQMVELALDALGKREQRVVKLHFGIGEEYYTAIEQYGWEDEKEGLDFAKIGEVLGLTRERVRQTWETARRKMHRRLATKRMESRFEERYFVL